MARDSPTAPIFPGKALTFFTLGASLHNVVTRIKAQPRSFPTLDLSYSTAQPVQQPVIVGLPQNGLRLRFDGPDQRLRLIEVLDFSKIHLTYKSNEVTRHSKGAYDDVKDISNGTGPSFKQIYHRLFGPSYPGEYLPPEDGSNSGTYVLSYPGVAFSFPLQHAAWSKGSDFVALLSSTAASSATSMAIFHGSSWSDARLDLYTRPTNFPRSASLKDVSPDEVDEIKILGGGRLELIRRSSHPFMVFLGETTPQDLVAELGPPDAIYRKSDNRISIHGNIPGREESGRTTSADIQRSDESEGEIAGDKQLSFYNYFHHGFDMLISYPTTPSPPFPNTPNYTTRASPVSALTVTKVILHGNVPGSYPFNRHRRSRWKIVTSGEEKQTTLTSETPFHNISDHLKQVWRSTYASREEEQSMQREMVLNRGWGESSESVELLGGWEESNPAFRNAQSLANTELFGFPGLLFEVLKNDTISCVTIY